MSERKCWRVWVDKDGQINSHRPYLPTSPVSWTDVRELLPQDIERERIQSKCDHWVCNEDSGKYRPSKTKFCADCGLQLSEGL